MADAPKLFWCRKCRRFLKSRRRPKQCPLCGSAKVVPAVQPTINYVKVAAT